jgi:hypothetical protein
MAAIILSRRNRVTPTSSAGFRRAPQTMLSHAEYSLRDRLCTSHQTPRISEIGSGQSNPTGKRWARPARCTNQRRH